LPLCCAFATFQNTGSTFNVYYIPKRFLGPLALLWIGAISGFLLLYQRALLFYNQAGWGSCWAKATGSWAFAARGWALTDGITLSHS
jgi:hypothetical protein